MSEPSDPATIRERRAPWSSSRASTRTGARPFTRATANAIRTPTSLQGLGRQQRLEHARPCGLRRGFRTRRTNSTMQSARRRSSAFRCSRCRRRRRFGDGEPRRTSPCAAKRPRRAAHESREGRLPGLTELVRDVLQAADKDEPSDRRWHRLVVRMLGEARETTTGGPARARPPGACAGRRDLAAEEGKAVLGRVQRARSRSHRRQPSLERAVFNPHLERKKTWNALQGSDELLDPGRAEIQRLQYRVAEAARP